MLYLTREDYNRRQIPRRMTTLLHWPNQSAILPPPQRAAALTILLASCLLSAAVPSPAQRGGGVMLDIVIMLEGEREPYNKPVTVTLRDGWGNVEGATTTDKGYVQLVANGDGVHRLLIVGPEIEMYDEEFSLGAIVGGTHTVFVQPRSSVIGSASPKDGGTVSSARLQVPKNAAQEFEKARKAWRRNNRLEAKAHLRKAIRLYPRYDDAFSALGDLELQDGDHEAARRDLTTALQLNPNHADAAHRLGQMLVAETKYAEAEPPLQVWLRSHPADAWALSFAALGLMTEGRFEEAAASAQRVHSLPHREYASAHLIAGRAFEHLRRFDAAAAEYRLYLTEAPSGPNVEQARAALRRLESGATRVSRPQ
jgi:tetratricopeptide (TPR) repeat protein